MDDASVVDVLNQTEASKESKKKKNKQTGETSSKRASFKPMKQKRHCATAQRSIWSAKLMSLRRKIVVY